MSTFFLIVFSVVVNIVEWDTGTATAKVLEHVDVVVVVVLLLVEALVAIEDMTWVIAFLIEVFLVIL